MPASSRLDPVTGHRVSPAPALPVDHDVVVGPQHKSFPPQRWGTTVGELAAARPELAEMSTPVLALDSAIVDSNLEAMRSWVSQHDLDLAPHGKTTMSPQLWQRAFDHGARTLTLATPWQVQVARAAGVSSVMLANTLVDPQAIRWVSAELDADPGFAFTSWVDSPDAVRTLLEVRESAGALRPLDVVVELGGSGGRTGARSVTEALEVAHLVASAPGVRLVGCGGYEGALAHDRSKAGTSAVRDYLRAVSDLHRSLEALGLYETTSAVVTVGGSAYFDLVADELSSLVDRDGSRGIATTVLLRSGAYVIHDDGFYRDISPLGDAAEGPGPRLRSAMHAYVRVVSRPETGLAVFDAGKRDLPFDEGLPVPRAVVGLDRARSDAALAGAAVTALNDQHGFLRLGPAGDAAVSVGTVVRLGLSHPCTALDKWRLVPVIDDHTADRPRVVDAIATWF